MTDVTLNYYVCQGTNATRVALTPVPATPAVGPELGVFFYETDTGSTYVWDTSGAGAWVLQSAVVTAAIATFLGTPSSANLAAAVTDETGTGALVFANTPTLVTPVLGVATATSVNKVAVTAPATSATLTIADGKTLTASNTITIAGTDGTTMTFPGVTATIPGVAVANTWTANQTITDVDIVLSATTGTKIGTATGQKLAFWNSTPVVQQVLATGGGATVDNVISLLQTLGLCKQA